MDETIERKNPSRETCEAAIVRILNAEVSQSGKNTHFKTAADFMKYFESLYPSSGALSKQVQRAVKSLDMPKDKDGYFIVNKTKAQYAKECEISSILRKENSYPLGTAKAELVFLKVAPKYSRYLASLLNETKSIRDKFITIIETSDGLLFITDNKERLTSSLDELINI